MTRSLSLVLLALMVAACDSSAPQAEPPVAISPAAFAVTDDAFPSVSAKSGAAYANVLNAGVRVGVVTSVTKAQLALPKLATAAATRQLPTVEGDVWTWQNTVDVLGTSVDVRLSGEAGAEDVRWRLVSTRAGGEPFTYYTAATDRDGRAGSWEVFHPGTDGAALTASFDVRDADDRTLTFTAPTGHLAGAAVTYRTAGGVVSFAYTAPDGARAFVQWDPETGAGFLEADDYNGGERACWNADLVDADC